MINLSTKFNMFTYYEDMKGNANVKLGWYGSLWVTQGHRKHNHSTEHIRFPVRL